VAGAPRSSLLHHGDAFLRLGPFRLATLSEEPFIGRTHGFLSEPEVRHLITVGGRCLKPRIFVGGDNDKEGESHIHHFTAKEICYVHKTRDLVVDGLVRRFELLTGTELRGQLLEHENLQLVNYGLGGSLRIHQDTSPFPFAARLATFMVYLSSPAGGHTVFPVQGVAEAPVAGDALLWHGMPADGNSDSRSLHLACPVLAGSKWVANLGWNLGQAWAGGRARPGEQWRALPCQRGGRHWAPLAN
jgi:prolyl 4-hydroxylase